jgi:hypothetical protein
MKPEIIYPDARYLKPGDISARPAVGLLHDIDGQYLTLR